MRANKSAIRRLPLFSTRYSILLFTFYFLVHTRYRTTTRTYVNGFRYRPHRQQNLRDVVAGDSISAYVLQSVKMQGPIVAITTSPPDTHSCCNASSRDQDCNNLSVADQPSGSSDQPTERRIPLRNVVAALLIDWGVTSDDSEDSDDFCGWHVGSRNGRQWLPGTSQLSETSRRQTGNQLQVMKYCSVQ